MNVEKARQIFLALAAQLPEQDEDPFDALGAGPQILHGRFRLRHDLFLRGEKADLYFQALDELNQFLLRDEAWNEDAIDSLLMKHLAAVFEAPPQDRRDIAQVEAKYLVQELKRAPDSFEVGLEVFGIRPECAGSRFGGVEFVQRTARVERQISEAGFHSEEEFSCASVSVKAMSDTAATERAERIIDRHLAALNTLSAMIVPLPTHLSRQPMNAQHRTASFLRKEGTDIVRSLTYRNRSIPLSPGNLKLVLERDVSKGVSKLLLEKSSWADRLIAAYQFAGAACVSQQPHVSFLLFAIALETAVLGKETTSELTFRLSVRVAHVLSSKLDSRRRLCQTMKGLYKLRSRIVHSGASDVSKGELSTIRHFCLAMLYSLAAAPYFVGMKKAEDIDEWFDGRILGDSEPLPEW